MIDRIEFENFKVLRSAKLRLSQCTLIVGPNGSGKSTALAPLRFLTEGIPSYEKARSASTPEGKPASVRIISGPAVGAFTFSRTSGSTRSFGGSNSDLLVRDLQAARIFSFDPNAIARSVPLTPGAQLQNDGLGFPAVLDRLRDGYPERFEALNRELHRWMPEFDRVLFETPAQGQRAIVLRTSSTQHAIPAADLSQGTLLSLALLTLVHLPSPPPIVALEEPDRGIHPRLLQEIRDALYRLSYPDSVGEKRSPVQVIVTTHSPYLLDLFRDHPEDIVIAQKSESGATFQQLSERKDLDEILRNAHLGDVWYSGVLGGVPIDR
jgi:predicted ATPase